MATDALGPSNAPDDDGLETPDRILYNALSTGMGSRLQKKHSGHTQNAHMHFSCTNVPCRPADTQSTLHLRLLRYCIFDIVQATGHCLAEVQRSVVRLQASCTSGAARAHSSSSPAGTPPCRAAAM